MKGWTDYLVENALHPKNQISSDNVGSTVTDSSKLAMKAIIGIGAMAQMSRAFGNSQDEMVYSANASIFALQWKLLALGSNTVTITYGDTDTFALMDDLYSDLLLGTELFGQDVYEIQNLMIKNGNRGNFGIPIDSNSNTTKSTSLMFVAGSLSKTDNSTKNQVVNDVFARAALGEPKTGGNFPVSYDNESGEMNNSQDAGQASPAQGAMFALLALSMPNQTIIVPDLLSGTSTSSSSKIDAGTIVGAVIGGLAGLVILVTAIIFFIKVRKRRVEQHNLGHLGLVAPFFGESGTSSFHPKNNYGQRSKKNSGYKNQKRSRGVTQLKQEVESLRREMEELRARARDYGPPPSYN
ncbi:hypothetical protein VKT23_017816 [Stygiomarasmius scandens]|uniref:Glutaminase A central domain-containing protein n=1 Tax=Marasmiellus scandens TaxID=2682957 RepID=A0ABR1IV06_9AGAR